MKNFTDKVVVVTGAGSGMGRAYALELARRGAALALNDYDAAALAETVTSLPSSTTVITEHYDVSDRDATYRFAARVQTELGGAHVVINNAGIEGGCQPVWATEDRDYERVMAVNFYGVVHGTRAFLPQLLARGEGAIVNVSSIFGLVGTPNHSDYNASKFAARGFTEALSAELLHTPITVHLVHPGGIDTNITRRAESQQFSGKYLSTSPEAIARVVLDAVGTRKGRIVYGHGARKTWLGARLLPQRLMARAVWRDMAPVIDRSSYPASAHAVTTSEVQR
ncbi:SDR family oxidoreductase [Nocardioides humilatus]|uniref:SDR family oxidoreductase n=1 Tax=Nocardioides humilatus TaxID=2607660 RepID=A0A5B1LM77_9ACTN|nr:SDR family oxidoreductase [Nocardioides humilatus]KAA1421653.1 SDR family oxidoreductase [Nocardioides humilatus]